VPPVTCVFGKQALRDMGPEALGKMLGDVDLPSWINFPDFERVRWVNTGASARFSTTFVCHDKVECLLTTSRCCNQRRHRRYEPTHACTMHAAPLKGVRCYRPATMWVDTIWCVPHSVLHTPVLAGLGI